MIKKRIKQEKHILAILCIYAFLLIFFCSKMSPLYPFNEWSDVNLYFNIGKTLFNGKVPYVDAFDHKGPFIFFIYGIGYLISNTSFAGMYIIESVSWAMMILAIYFTARLYLDQIYAFVVALISPILMLSHTSQGGSAEEFILIFEAISLYLFVSYFKEKNASVHKPIYMFIHGLMCAMTFLIKMNLIVFWFFPLFFIFVNLILKKEYKNLIYNAISYTLGLMVFILPTCLYFYANNALSDAWDIYIVLNKNYAKLHDINIVLENLIVRFYQRIRFETFEYFIILIGVIYFPLKYIGNTLGKAAIMLSFIALHIVIFMSPNYVYYYSIPYYIFSALGCIAILSFIYQYLKIKSTWYLYLIFTVIALGIGVKEKNFFGEDVDVLLRKKATSDLISQFSNIITKEQNPTLLNLSLDLGNGVFTKVGIMPNVKYFISPNLPYSSYPDMRDQQTIYIENKEVQFIILSQSSFNFDYFFNLPALNENYKIITTCKEGEYKTYYLYKRKD